MPIQKDQRVGVFVDIQNMYYSAKQFYNSKVNFGYILNKAVARRKLIRAIAYVIKADIREEENFFDALEKLGYEVKSKDLQIFFGGAKKGDWDVGIAMDIMRMASKLDVVVLVSGDGDFKDLIEHVKALGCRAEVIAFGKTASSRIIGQADEFLDLDRDLDKVLINDKPYERIYEKKQSKKQDKNIKENKNSFFGIKDFNKRDIMDKNKYSVKDRNNTNKRDYDVSFLQKINMEQPVLQNKTSSNSIEEYNKNDKMKEFKEDLDKNIKNENFNNFDNNNNNLKKNKKVKYEFVEPIKNDETNKTNEKFSIDNQEEKKNINEVIEQEIKVLEKEKLKKDNKEKISKKKKGLLDNVFSKISKKK